MPFDDRTFPLDSGHTRHNRRLVALWLFAVCFMIAVMVALGGVTRLTGSGLSIMEWAPVSGALPPLSHADWEKLFALYKQIPQYALLHDGMTLSGFKQIFWLEWIHRLWGRLIGVVFLLPLIWFSVTGRIERRLRPRLVLIFVLGGLQGAVGWFMVASGFFPDSTAVAPARLVIHLSLALVLYAAILWTGLSVLHPEPTSLPEVKGLRRLASASVGLIALTIVAGGFVAGTHAGFDYNTFPLMDGHLIPESYARLTPFLRNLTQNIAAVQFDHRLLATLTAITVLATVATGLGRRLPRRPRRALLALGAAVLAQYALGVATLLSVVQVGLAAAHQTTAVLLLTAALVTLHALRGQTARQVTIAPPLATTRTTP
jgi:cytochrome c oxidase assembly protein subunit 15